MMPLNPVRIIKDHVCVKFFLNITHKIMGENEFHIFGTF